MLAARAVSVLAVAVAVGGCEAAVSTQPERVRSTVDAFRLACVREDPIAAMQTLTVPQREVFVDATSTLEACAETAGLAISDELDIKAALEEAEITEVVIHGDTGHAVLDTPPEYDDGILAIDSTGLEWNLYASTEER